MERKHESKVSSHSFSTVPCKGVPKLTQDLNLIENTVFSIDYVIFLLNYKVICGITHQANVLHGFACTYALLCRKFP